MTYLCSKKISAWARNVEQIASGSCVIPHLSIDGFDIRQESIDPCQISIEENGITSDILEDLSEFVHLPTKFYVFDYIEHP